MTGTGETAIAMESKQSTWELLNEFRFISTLGRWRNGEMILQQAMRCREDGAIKWHRIGLTILSEEDFSREISS